jgi:4-hydroxy-tetrahydrodipicolinate synthase
LRNIVGVKDATGNVGRISLQRQAMGPEFLQFSGDDLTALACFAAGAVGCISVVSNIAPRPCADLWEAAAAGEYAKALAIQDRLTPLHVATFLEAGVSGAKTGLNLLSRAGDGVRLPLVSSTGKTREAIKAAMVSAGVLAG